MAAVNKMEKVEKRWSARHRVTSSYSPALSELYSEYLRARVPAIFGCAIFGVLSLVLVYKRSYSLSRLAQETDRAIYLPSSLDKTPPADPRLCLIPHLVQPRLQIRKCPLQRSKRQRLLHILLHPPRRRRSRRRQRRI